MDILLLGCAPHQLFERPSGHNRLSWNSPHHSTVHYISGSEEVLMSVGKLRCWASSPNIWEYGFRYVHLNDEQEGCY